MRSEEVEEEMAEEENFRRAMAGFVLSLSPEEVEEILHGEKEIKPQNVIMTGFGEWMPPRDLFDENAEEERQKFQRASIRRHRRKRRKMK